jgi:hypothetical protein
VGSQGAVAVSAVSTPEAGSRRVPPPAQPPLRRLLRR